MSARTIEDIPVLPSLSATIAETVLQHMQRVLIYGPPGVGKSTQAGELARELHSRGDECTCIGADPGSPGFGLPGAVSLAKWDGTGWQVEETLALCSLDAGRFRLPLVASVQRLTKALPQGTLLIDGPGVVRGPSGRELLQSLAAEPPLPDELLALGSKLYIVRADEQARRPGKRVRARRRTERWEAYLAGATDRTIETASIHLIGTPPPLTESGAWPGRQVALLRQG